MGLRITVASLLTVLASLGASAFGWWSLVSPTAFRFVPTTVIYAFNVPAAVVGTAYGRSVQDGLFDAVVQHCHYCSAEEHMLSYFAAAVPGYAVLFGGSVACAWWWHSRRRNTT